jgi:hypothetical protein
VKEYIRVDPADGLDRFQIIRLSKITASCQWGSAALARISHTAAGLCDMKATFDGCGEEGMTIGGAGLRGFRFWFSSLRGPVGDAAH